jgi:hypothetical protein
MGLLNLIPPDNKLGQLLMGFQQPLNDLGVGLQRGKTWQKGIREASEYTEEQAPLRAEMAQTQAKAQNDITARNKTAAYLRSQPGGAQFADAIETGMIDGSTAFKSWLDASRAEASYRPMTVEEKIAAGLPPDMPAQIGPNGKIDPIGGGGQTINVNTADGGASGDFYKSLDSDAGKQQATLIDAGRNAASNNMRLGQLDALLANAPQGAAGVFTQAAGSVGIPMQGLDDLQAAQALINQMVPGQRPPGSGTMSDADLALFKQSLPAIINQPGGNKKIIATARAINEYTIAQAAIAEQVANREITPAEGRARQAAIPNPLASFGGAPAGGSTREGIDDLLTKYGQQ